MMTNFIIILIIAAIIGLAGGYVYRAKKRGEKCIGCPAAKAGACGACPGCSTKE
ncbi:MAG: FeoB-associated Cys-rich membrane protein [Clostridia bacterium]|nr:FeoB-associated Cys-rich membrane protein [Clostridia bacterium]MBQ4611803.1 FeoB-associated Cys-rich membrane protein [Clostridia bacterium]MBQ6703935.1 FeoB-associated Cys-rich membrane protein [Clostridia bacterium]